MVRDLVPTDVPMALATSFAPIPQAIKKPKGRHEHQGGAVIRDNVH
jgi:hypothetical protein